MGLQNWTYLDSYVYQPLKAKTSFLVLLFIHVYLVLGYPVFCKLCLQLRPAKNSNLKLQLNAKPSRS